MAPLICLNGDEIVEALLLEPRDDEPRTSPTPEEEATFLGEELELQQTQEATASPHECMETPEPEEPTKQFGTPVTPAPLSMTSHGDPSQKAKRSQ